MTTPSKQDATRQQEPVKKAWRVRSENGLIPQAILSSYGKYTAETEYRIMYQLSDSVKLLTEEVKNGGS